YSSCSAVILVLDSFPTRRSSDLVRQGVVEANPVPGNQVHHPCAQGTHQFHRNNQCDDGEQQQKRQENKGVQQDKQNHQDPFQRGGQKVQHGKVSSVQLSPELLVVEFQVVVANHGADLFYIFLAPFGIAQQALCQGNAGKSITVGPGR